MEGKNKSAYLLDVVKQTTAFFDSFDNGSEVVVSEDHLGCIFGDIASGTHSHADIGLLERWRVVDTVSSHDTEAAPPVKSLHHLDFGGRATSGDDKRKCLHGVNLIISHLVKIFGDHDG
jgi:hypothetical protein